MEPLPPWYPSPKRQQSDDAGSSSDSETQASGEDHVEQASDISTGLLFSDLFAGAATIAVVLVIGLGVPDSRFVIGAAVGILGLVVYLLPVVVAHHRNVSIRKAVTVLNVLLGWTVIGWVIAFAMAIGGDGTILSVRQRCFRTGRATGQSAES